MDQRDVAKDGRNVEGGEKFLRLAKIYIYISQISASGDFNEWLQKRNVALKPILWEICSNSYSDWKERNEQYSYGVRNLVKLGTL